MSYEEKGVWSYLLAAVVGYLVYVAIVVPRLIHTPVQQVSYLPPLLVTTLAWAAAGTIGRSVVEVVSPSDSGRPDARDLDIARFGEHASRWCLVTALSAGCVMAFDQWPYFWIANTTYFGLVLALVVGSIFRVVAYRRGM